ncbi:MAG: tetratricopeptide repeat protein, partial [Myxococcota bacterium]
IARSLLDAGAPAEARTLLDEVLRDDPLSSMARFYRGIAFRAQGRVVESNREFAIAGRLAPALRPETLLARALGLFELGQEAAAVDLLRLVLQLDPGSESAIRARLLLRQKELLGLKRAWRIDAYAGFEWDDNVILASAENETPQSESEDVRGIWGLGATFRALNTEKGSLTLGYRFDESLHDELGRFDLIANTGLVSGSWRQNDQLIVRLDGLIWNIRQDGNNELTAGSLRPNVIVSLGPDWGALRFFAQFEILEYADDAIVEPWERDGVTFGGGVEHFLALPLRGSWLSTSGSFQQTLTQSKTTGMSDGFDGDYDYDSGRIRSRVSVPLPWQIRARVEATYSLDRYHNDNFLNVLDTSRIRKRRDNILSGRVVLSRAIVQHVEFEVYWRGTWRMSNVPAFDYERQIVGAVVRVSTD